MISITQGCVYLATFGGLGRWIGGGFLASFWAFAFLLLGKGMYMISPASTYWLFGLFFLCSCTVIALATAGLTPEEYDTIVLDKVLGMTIAFGGLHFSTQYWKLFLAGFLLYHILNLLKPILLYNETLKKISQAGALGILASAIIFGLSVNIFIRVGIWLFYTT